MKVKKEGRGHSVSWVQSERGQKNRTSVPTHTCKKDTKLAAPLSPENRTFLGTFPVSQLKQTSNQSCSPFTCQLSPGKDPIEESSTVSKKKCHKESSSWQSVKHPVCHRKGDTWLGGGGHCWVTKCC